MDYRKETFFNTEELMANRERRKTVRTSLPSAKRVGGVRFYSDAKCEVEFEMTFFDLTGAYTPYIDGVPVSEKRSPAFHLTCVLEKGEHIFDVVSDGNHKGASVTVSGGAIRRYGRYLNDIGSAYLPTRAIAFVRLGKRKIEKYERSNNQTTVSDMNAEHVDAAFYYNKSVGAYASDLVVLSSTSDSEVKVITGNHIETIPVNGLTSCALIDGLGLSADFDFIAAVADESGDLRFYAFPFDGTPALCANVISGVKEVKSAGRGSLLLYSNGDGLWKAMQFWQGGLYSVVCGNAFVPYDLLTITRNKTFAPSCNVEVDMRYPFFYYKKDSNVLVRRNSAGTETVVSYADAFVSGAFAGFSISENDVSYTS
ncbi:MAG: hypothetical protein K5753_01210 [Clostridia bacterium]|nr:hypothetical protein [Clostridia bacterium]